MEDLFEVARVKICPHLIHTLFNSDGSYTKNGEYYILSPLRSDRHVGSFRINEETGLWIDSATQEGGDLIDLICAVKNIGKKAAAEYIINESGSTYVKTDIAGRSSKTKQKKEKIKPLLPIPVKNTVLESLTSRINENWCIEYFGNPVTVTRYYNEKNQWVFCVVRFNDEKKEGHNDILFYYGIDNKWWSGAHEDLRPYPPYGIEKIKENNLPILFVEGEKCGRQKVEGYNVVSWYGGVNQLKNTNWEILKKLSKGRTKYIWPDADSQLDKNKEHYLPVESQPGMAAAYYLKSVFPDAKILEIYRAKPLDENPRGWDIADFIEEGGDPCTFIEEYTPYKSVDVEIDSYAVYRRFIDDFYHFDSLDQCEGWFWEYNKELHFWDKTNKNDIFCNLQRWIEATGLQWIIGKKQEPTKFINRIKQYLDRHSVGYVKMNPFKDAAISPYIHFKNGAINIKKNSIEWLSRNKYDEDFFKKLYPMNCLEFDFDFKNYGDIKPERDCPAFYHVIKELIPKQYIKILDGEEEIEKVINDTMLFISQIIAYAISPVKNNEYCFGLYGPQRTGKSFLLKIIRSIIGNKFCIETPIANMENRFASSMFWGKKVYIEPDLKTRQSLPEDFIKTYSGNQTVTMEEKNKPAVDGVQISIAMFFVSNYEFHVKGLEGISRRMILIPYKNIIEKHDTHLFDKITGQCKHGSESGERAGEVFDERGAIVALAMKGWEVFCNDYLISVPHWVNKEKEQWIIESNSVQSYLDEEYYSKGLKEQISRTDLYEGYKTWCNENGRKPLGKKNLYEELRMDKRITELRIGGIDNFLIDPDQNDFIDDGTGIPF